MALIPVPNEPGRKLWVDRADPQIWIVLDHWDSERRHYEFHDLDHPENRGSISAGILDACYDPVGSAVPTPAVAPH